MQAVTITTAPSEKTQKPNSAIASRTLSQTKRNRYQPRTTEERQVHQLSIALKNELLKEIRGETHAATKQ
ncbi:MAG: hypothetical protein NWE98_06630 [Candidatus Bathyarchaeota archaeon]|nr:hypothetical protein [Candidatus Bathyarchaeota archaeon]